jgi:uracil-DNA glycosylase
MVDQTIQVRTAALHALQAKAEKSGAEVLGEGNPSARLMLVGEAPGKSEVEAHRPFVGQAGLILNQMLDQLAIPRRQLWITNAVKLRPVAAGVASEVNRAPTTSEVAAFRAILDEEISIVRPRVILCLGAVAASTLIHPNFRILSERGRWFPGPFGARLTATYHPAYLLRRRGPDYEIARDQMLADLSRAWGEALGE